MYQISETFILNYGKWLVIKSHEIQYFLVVALVSSRVIKDSRWHVSGSECLPISIFFHYKLSNKRSGVYSKCLICLW